MGRRQGCTNVEKHGVAFEEAARAFGDPLFVIFADPDHSADEHRFLLLAESATHRLLVVSYTERGGVVRIIGAREATNQERRSYEEEL